MSQERKACGLRNKIKHEIQAEATDRDGDAEGDSSTKLSGRSKLVFVSFDTQRCLQPCRRGQSAVAALEGARADLFQRQTHLSSGTERSELPLLPLPLAFAPNLQTVCAHTLHIPRAQSCSAPGTPEPKSMKVSPIHISAAHLFP